MKARVSFACGRFYLAIGDVIVAMEADPCRDPRFKDNQWNRENLREAADLINAELGPK